MLIQEYNCETGIETLRDVTKAELAQKKIDREAQLARQAETEAKAQAKAAILDRLGLTADEAKLILG
jgi:hypothetical protein